MHYLGGRHRQGVKMAQFLNRVLKVLPDQDAVRYYEPFLGAGGIMTRVKAPFRAGGDVSHDLMLLWQAVLYDGWKPPHYISREDWLRLRADPLPSPLRSFAGFAASRLGLWFSVYAGEQVLGGHDSLMRKVPLMAGVELFTGDYSAMPMVLGPSTVVMLDPPYQGTNHQTREGFDIDYPAYWRWARELAATGARVYASGYDIQPGWKPVLDISYRMKLPNAERWQPDYVMRPLKPDGS